jgi:hypothetical protein
MASRCAVQPSPVRLTGGAIVTRKVASDLPGTVAYGRLNETRGLATISPCRQQTRAISSHARAGRLMHRPVDRRPVAVPVQQSQYELEWPLKSNMITTGPGKGCASVGLKLSTYLMRLPSRFLMVIFLMTGVLLSPACTWNASCTVSIILSGR